MVLDDVRYIVTLDEREELARLTPGKVYTHTGESQFVQLTDKYGQATQVSPMWLNPGDTVHLEVA